jgi:glycosyltransferase involved in cell wall biosynthesis
MERSQGQIYNVIYAWNYLRWGGAQIYLLSIIRNAPPKWHFTLLIPRDSHTDLIKFFEPYGVSFEFIDHSLFEKETGTIFEKIKRQWSRVRAELEMYSRLSKRDPRSTLIHIESAPWQSWMFLFLLTLRFHVFVTLHNALTTEVSNWRASIWRRRLRSLVNRKRFHLFAANRDAIEKMGFFLPHEDTAKIRLTRAAINPVEINDVLAEGIDRGELREKHGLSRDKFLVLSIGQFIDRKGRWIFLEAARELLKQHSDIEFAWIAPRIADSGEIKRIEGYGLGDRFRLILSADIGPGRRDVLGFLRAADIFALPSLWEGLPISILEAMALRLPTISTDVNAIPEAVINNETGILIEPGNVKALVQAVSRLKEDSHLRERLSQNGVSHVLKHFDEREAAKIALNAYEESLKNG